MFIFNLIFSLIVVLVVGFLGFLYFIQPANRELDGGRIIVRREVINEVSSSAKLVKNGRSNLFIP